MLHLNWSHCPQVSRNNAACFVLKPCFIIISLTPHAGSQASFNVTVRPRLYGIYESTRARIKYGSGTVEIEGVEPDFRNGYSTSLGRIKIISAAEYERSSSYHVKEWSVFALLYSLPTVLPFVLWLSAKSLTEKLSTKRKGV